MQSTNFPPSFGVTSQDYAQASQSVPKKKDGDTDMKQASEASVDKRQRTEQRTAQTVSKEAEALAFAVKQGFISPTEFLQLLNKV